MRPVHVARLTLLLRLMVTFYLGVAGAVEVLRGGQEAGEDAPFLPCSNVSHPQDVFQCSPGLCVALELRCNGVPDCPEGADEAVVECGCLPNEYQCGVTCIDLGRRCDTRPDCPDGEDEKDCETYECPVTHFKCDNHYCVPSELVCDFDDHCGDGSDEHQCHHRKCWKAEFECDNGQCIRPGRVCDGDVHCKDGSDERHCRPGDFAVCGSGARVHRYYWCDGWPHCSDNHADELNCGECGAPGREYRCPNTRCLPAANVCDAVCDCLPGCEDESTCANASNATYSTTDGVRRCHVGQALWCQVPNRDRRMDRCISEPHICDGYNDCHNGGYLSDEYGCETSTCPGETTQSGGSRWFRCKDGRCLPPHLLCDHKPDCLHGEDEDNCSRTVCKSNEWLCESGQCIPAEARCDLVFHCLDKSDEIGCGVEACKGDSRRCGGGQCVPSSLWCDWIPDCPDASDEENCERPAECEEGMFRCGSGQCIALAYLCDAAATPRLACADESHLLNCSGHLCGPGLWKCDSGPCLPPSHLCDGQVQCPLTWEDEDHCPFSCSSSAPQCECRDISITCQRLGLHRLPRDIEPQISRFHLSGNFLNFSLDAETFLPYSHLVYLDMSNNSLTVLPSHVFFMLGRLKILDLRNNLLTVMSNSTFLGLANLRTLHLEGNAISTLDGWAFYGLSSLSTLDLSHQKLGRIDRHAFLGLRSLLSLNASHNRLRRLTSGSLSGLSTLLSLDLRENQLSVVEPRVFSSLATLHQLWIDEFRFCCLARRVPHCYPLPDQFSSCEDLMTNGVLRVCVWVLASLALSGNSLVIVWRLLYETDNKVHSFLITNLALGDLCMGLYLLIIAAVDVTYRGVYFIYDAVWRTSPLCQLAGFLSTFSSELSVFTLTVITVERLVVIVFPFQVPRLTMAGTRTIMAVVWACVTLLAALPLLDIPYFRNFYGRSGVCLALHITHEKPNGWQYSVFVFLALNLASFSVIAVSYWRMYLAARTSRAAVRNDFQRRESIMARKMTLIVVTDAACWLPIILLGVVSLAGVTIPPQVFAWVAVFVLPLNAAINPLLYTLSTAPFLSKARQRARDVRTSFRWSLSRRATTLSTSEYRATLIAPVRAL
ncbi:G-protein coupled receptor GRL101-like [Portunus trituberculatus]|uniref:G-protein coupled receptor GRL101-like n=1 Tax=Portunus trituberculatus TaxID=210409 RepID=UPI001E1CB4D6|nr:G-protein coupled receptor GRL101-like [Portunus trituberculatus]